MKRSSKDLKKNALSVVGALLLAGSITSAFAGAEDIEQYGRVGSFCDLESLKWQPDPKSPPVPVPNEAAEKTFLMRGQASSLGGHNSYFPDKSRKNFLRAQRIVQDRAIQYLLKAVSRASAKDLSKKDVFISATTQLMTLSVESRGHLYVGSCQGSTAESFYDRTYYRPVQNCKITVQPMSVVGGDELLSRQCEKLRNECRSDARFIPARSEWVQRALVECV